MSRTRGATGPPSGIGVGSPPTVAGDIWWCLKNQPAGHAPAHRVDAEERDGTPRRKLVCVRCRRPVTGDDARIDMNGRHRHVFANPHGFAFEIGCFAGAPGCFGVGPRDAAFSWFPGYTWQLALCRACHMHLGWNFQAGDTVFHGLVLERLVPEDTLGGD